MFFCESGKLDLSYMGSISGNMTQEELAVHPLEQARLQIHRMELQKELHQKSNNREDYDSIAEEIFQLRELHAVIKIHPLNQMTYLFPIQTAVFN